MKFIILDRDGTINRDEHGYTHRLEDLEILPGVIEGLLKFRDAGFEFIVVTNQAGIARQKYTEDMHRFNNKLVSELAKYDTKIKTILFCPHHPEITGDCDCRKPNTGLIKQAERQFNFKASDCIFIGDKDSDIQLGKNCYGKTVLIINDKYENNTEPD